MDIDDAKENIQPLAQGRNASILHASLRIESAQELLAQRKVLEKEIHDYNGDDPLSVWYNYIEWIEQSFPSGGKESGLQEVLSKCLAQFESDERYKQDRRMIKLYIKFIESHKDPSECYQQLFNAGIGTMVADFYIAWAYCYDLVGNTRKADEIFLRGIACRAQPLEDLQEARQHFGFSVAQRLMYKDDDPIREETNRQLHERRVALTSLRAHRRKLVGSMRTGPAIKCVSPGKVKVNLPSTSSQRGNSRVQVFKDENPNVVPTSLHDSTSPNEPGKSVVRSIIDAARDQENQKEPGPWNRAHNHKKGKLFGGSKTINELGFAIHEDLNDNVENVKKPCNPPIPIADDEIKFDKPFVYPANFCAISKPIKGWITPVTTEEKPDENTLPEYNKCKLYPRPNMEFQPEELKGYNFVKKRGIENNFTKERDVYWGCGPQFNIRLYPHFATKSQVKTTDKVDHFFIPEKVPGLEVSFDEIYKKNGEIELQFEEILASRIKRNKTIIETADMEETICTTSENIRRRKSFFPLRKSIAPVTYKSSIKTSVIVEQKENLEKPLENELASNASIVSAGAKIVEAKPDVIQKSNKLESLQVLGLETKIAVRNEEHQNLYVQCNNETESQSQVVNEKVVSKALSPVPFEIYKDESVEAKCIRNVQDENDFHFKTPALPVPSCTSADAVPRKLPFEIFDDENLQQNGSEFGCGAVGFFDAEETCSTQTFNIFLKAQSVSTPKAVTKSKPQRQFGNVLKEVSPLGPIEDTIETQSPISTEEISAAENQNLAPNSIAFSPPRERLSTILETSEHGTTQSTHTTGATTKSTISSPDFDIESQMQATANVGSNQPHTVLETVKELSCETSVDKMMESLKIQNTNKSISKSLSSAKNVETPVAMRLQNKYTTDGLEKSIFELSIKNYDKQAGNFSRLEEKEDTAAGIVFKTLPSIQFQDDKTETIPKMLITSQQFKFQDEKTETISKMMFEHPMPPSKYLEDKTETVSKIFVDPPPSVKFPEEKTETISKFMLEVPESKTFEDNQTELKHSKKEKSLRKDMNQDDSFEFFGHSPPKALKHCFFKQAELVSLSQVRTANECRTPLTYSSKRYCGNETAAVSKPIVLFEDELQPDYKSKHPVDIKSNMKDSFLSDFLLIEEKQQNIEKPKSKSVFRDSFIPDFSLIEDSQPKTKQNQSKSQLKAVPNESILPEFSFIKTTQPKSSNTEDNQIQSKNQLQATSNESIVPEFSFIKNTQTKSIKPELNDPGNISIVPDFLQTNKVQSKSQLKASSNESILPEFSFIQNTQPKSSYPEQTNTRNMSIVSETQHNESVIQSSQSTESRRFQQSFLPSSAASQNFSTNDLKNYKTDANISQKKIPKSNITSQNTQDRTTMKNNLMDTFMKDFSEIVEPPPIPNDVKQISLVKSCKNSSSLRFLDESLKQKSENEKNIPKSFNIDRISTGKETKLTFLTTGSSEDKKCRKESQPHGSDIDKFFELNCETEMFGTNISMIKNSTWLPNHGPTLSSNPYQAAQIHEKSLHIKPENVSKISVTSAETSKQDRKSDGSSAESKFCVSEKSYFNNDLSIELSKSELAEINAKCFPKNPNNTVVIPESPEETEADNKDDMSIYYKQTPKTPKPQLHIWDDSEAFKSNNQNHYVRAEPDLNHTQQLIENIAIDPNVNPFNVDLINAFLEQHYVISYLESLPTCKLVGCVQRLKPNAKIDINGISFSVLKLIGEGAYGAVFCGKENRTGKKVAMKQEKPPNFWEYYICLEIQERISYDEMLQSYMSVDYALIGNNSSILISKFSNYGSLITVCNKIKKQTMKNVDEYVVMLLASELLEIIDHLHAVNIIHADIKADNFLLMNKLTYPQTERHLQLIDFGVSIDMKLFKDGQTFSFVHNENSFKCPEMREDRPWTYQLDLYGLAGVIHVLLFGKYMDIEKKARGFWMHKTHVPRYINKDLWDEIFKTLLNIRDCKSMPNLQDLRVLLKKEMVEKEKYVLKMVNEFNGALSA